MQWREAWRSREAVAVNCSSVFFFNAWLHGPVSRGISAQILEEGMAFKEGSVPSHIFSANVPDEVSLLAYGVVPAQAGSMT